MKINEILLEAPKKKAAKKKAPKKKDLYKAEPLADLDLQEAAIAAAKKVATAMKEKCQPWLKASKQGSLIVYRGVSDRSGLAFTKKTREDRRPMDTDAKRHKAFNAAIEAAGGVANRSNALFCSSSMDTASAYGNVYVLIPIGDFNFTWSPKWHDWTNNAKGRDLRNLLKPDVLGTSATKEAIAKLKAKFPAYKAKKVAVIEASLKKELAALPAKIKKLEAKYDAMPPAKKKQWNAKYIKSEIEEYKRNLKILNNPKTFQERVERKFKYVTEYDHNNPLNKIKRLQQPDNYKVPDEALVAANYDPAKVKSAIYADKNLDQAVKSKKEIMISCEAGIYVKPKFYKDFVLPTLRGKKITSKYEIETSNYDDSW